MSKNLSHQVRRSIRVCNSLCTRLLLAAAIAWAIAPAEPAYGSDTPQGAPRRWEPSIPVGLYSDLNLHTGRMLTTIPVVGWGGRGPSMAFVLYHNMNSPWGELITPIGPSPIPVPGGSGQVMGDANGDGQLDGADIDPFVDIVLESNQTQQDLSIGDFNATSEVGGDDFDTFMSSMSMQAGGPQWSHSYSAYLIVEAGDVTVIRDDGTRDVFEGDGQGGFVAPDGIFETLTYNGGSDRYTLKSKSQWRATFEANPYITGEYRLLFLQDASGNKITCHYIFGNPETDPTAGKLLNVEDASFRVLNFWYSSTTGRLARVSDPIGRDWQFLYDGDPNTTPPGQPGVDGTGPFVILQHPQETGPQPPPRLELEFAYTGTWDLLTIEDKDGDPYAFEYDRGRVVRVTDPPPFDDQTQEFYYDVDVGMLVTTYVDRRGNPWEVKTKQSTDNLFSIENPHGQLSRFFYQLLGSRQHELTKFTDALNRSWQASYDTDANVLSTTDPLGNKWTFEYDSLNNLITVTPPGQFPGQGNADKQVTLEYADLDHSTSVTKIIEPAAEAGGDPAETLIEYYAPDYDDEISPGPVGEWSGLVKKVTPPSSHPGSEVVTEFRYDRYGQPAEEREGPPSTGGAPLTIPPDAFTMTTSYNEAGQLVGGNNGVSSGGVGYDANGNVVSSDCKDLISELELGGPIGGYDQPPICYPPGCGAGCCAFFDPNDPWAHPYIPLPDHKREREPPFNSGCLDQLNPPQYTPMGQVTFLSKCVFDDITHDNFKRQFTYAYDALGRLSSNLLESNESTEANNPPGVPGLLVPRLFTYDPDWQTGTYIQTGPDGSVTLASFDVANRLEFYVRTAAVGGEIVSAEFTYLDNGLPATITYGDGSQTLYDFDLANRLIEIWHKNAAEATIHKLNYDWSPDGLVDSITETDDAGAVSTIDFTYDRRNRLTEEVRGGVNPYHLRYTYDAAGNRLTKEDLLAGLTTEYTYDVSAPGAYGSQGNRLMKTRLYDTATEDPVEERWFTYDDAGRAEFVVRIIAGDEDENGQWYRGTQMYHDTQGRIWLSRLTRWQLAEEGEPPELAIANTEFLAAMEYRYDAGRQRYMVRPRNPEGLAPYPSGYGGFALDNGSWHEYTGQSIYGDYAVEFDETTGEAEVTETFAHAPGAVQYDYAQPAGARRQSLRGNLVGTTERMVGESGVVTQRSVYTAFGELAYQAGVGQTRYGYCGAWGYQAASAVGGYLDPLAELGWLHVGERYYDPASGRFMQRDPIGIVGGLNVYVYVNSIPTLLVDPMGLWSLIRWIYTGDGNASDEVYDAAVEGAGEWLYGNSPVRGGYVGVGLGGNRGPRANLQGRWTMDSGASVCGGLGLGGSRRGRDPNSGRFVSNGGELGIGGGWSEEGGWSGGGNLGIGQTQKGNGAGASAGTDGEFDLGINAGIFQGGITLRLW